MLAQGITETLAVHAAQGRAGFLGNRRDWTKARKLAGCYSGQDGQGDLKAQAGSGQRRGGSRSTGS